MPGSPGALKTFKILKNIDYLTKLNFCTQVQFPDACSVSTCRSLQRPNWCRAASLRPGRGLAVCSTALGCLIRRIVNRDRVMTAQPAIEVHLGTASGTEGVELLLRGLVADGAGPSGSQSHRLGHVRPCHAPWTSSCETPDSRPLPEGGWSHTAASP